MKNIFKKFLIGTLAVVAFVITANLALASYDFGSATLKVGSRGQYVTTLQNLVGAIPVDGVFGPKTKAKVVAWQAAHDLTADGLFGNMSKAKANGAISGNFPAGCASAAGFSTVTGVACSSLNANTFSAGCTNASGFSVTTGLACVAINANTFPAGCTNASGFSITTGLACSSLSAHTFPVGCFNASGFSITTGYSCSTGLPATTTPIIRSGGSSGGHHDNPVVVYATAPSAIDLAVGSVNPVGGVTNVAIPLPGATNITGAVTGWTIADARNIKFTVTDVAPAVSAITIGGTSFTSGNDLTIGATTPLTIVVTTSEAGKTDAVRTFTVTVAAAAYATVPTSIDLTAGTFPVTIASNVAIPLPGATNAAGAITGWITDTNDDMVFMVVDNTSASTIKIGGATYASGTNYTIPSLSSLSIVVTTTEALKTTAVRTFTVTVSEPITPVTSNPAYTTVSANHIVTITLTGGGTFKAGEIDQQDFIFTGTGNDWNVIAAATTFTRASDTEVIITGIDGLLGAVDNMVAVLAATMATQATGVTAVASTPTDVTDASFTTVVGDNNVTVTLTGGTFKADPIDAADFIFTGADEAALEGATTFTRTNNTVVTITGLSALGGIDNTVTVLGEAQATQATSVAGASSLLLTNVTSGEYTTVTGNNDILITLTGGGTFKAGEIDQQDFTFAGAEDHMVIVQATSFTRASDTEVIIAGIGPLAGFTTNTITVPGTTMAIQATGVTVVASTVNVYAIGNIGPAGGLIVTRNGTSNNYLESAPANFHPGTKVWSSTADDLATSEAMGTGQTNTNTILASLGGQTSTATQFCDGLSIGANDWFLPSLDELNLMYTNLQVAGLGGFRGSNASYWSSSQFNISNASVVNFTDGTPGNSDKSANMGPYTRCVRAFHANESIVAPITATFAHNVAGDPIITVTALTNGAGVNMLGAFITDNGTDFSYTLTNGGTPAIVTKAGGSANLTIATPADASDAGAYTLTITRVNGGVGKWAIAVTVADDLLTVDPANGSTVSATTPASPTHAVNFTYTVTVKDNTTAHAFVSGLNAGSFSEAAFDTGTQNAASGTLDEVSVVEVTSGVYTVTATFSAAHAGMDIETTVLGVKITAEVTNVVVQ